MCVSPSYYLSHLKFSWLMKVFDDGLREMYLQLVAYVYHKCIGNRLNCDPVSILENLKAIYMILE